MSRRESELTALRNATQTLLNVCEESPESAPAPFQMTQIKAILERLEVADVDGARAIYAAIRASGVPLGLPWPPDAGSEEAKYRATIVHALLRSWSWSMDREAEHPERTDWAAFVVCAGLYWVALVVVLWFLWLIIEGMIRFIVKGIQA